MAPKIGYLLPTRERVMEAQPDGVALLDLAERAEGLDYDSVWIGDSLFDKPRHEPLTMVAGIAGRTSKVALGTAVLPALRNPLLLAQQLACALVMCRCCVRPIRAGDHVVHERACWDGPVFDLQTVISW